MNRLLRADRSGTLYAAPLQGATARARLPAGLTARLTTVVLLDARGLAVRSEALLRIAAHLGGPWRLLALLRLVPRPLRDAGYAWVAARRHRLPARLGGSAQPPGPEQRARFLP